MNETQINICGFLCLVVSAYVLKTSRENKSRDALLRGELRRADNHVQKQMKNKKCSNLLSACPSSQHNNTSLELVASIEKVPTQKYSLYNE